MTLQDLLDMRDDVNGLIVAIIIVGTIALIWLAILSVYVFMPDGGTMADKIKILDKRQRELMKQAHGLEQFVCEASNDYGRITNRIYILEQRLDSPVTPEPRRTVKSAVEEGIHEMASIEKWRQELIAVHGDLPMEMEELFAAYRTQVKNRRLGQLDRELAELMGTEAVR